MTNRELLEQAAAAAGYEIDAYVEGVLFIKSDKPCLWDPLTMDDDAFRLMVDLNLCVESFSHFVSVSSFTPHAPLIVKEYLGRENRHSVVRRAIVECAAAIHRSGSA